MLSWLQSLIFGGVVAAASCGDWQTIQDRNSNPTYRMQIPAEWVPIKQESMVDLSDTREALCTYQLPHPAGNLTLVIHNFPNDQSSEQIPAQAQVNRWLQQFEELDPLATRLEPQSFSGFQGMRVQAAGIKKGKREALLGWGFNLTGQHYRVLSHPKTTFADTETLRQMRGDITIKVTGPVPAMEHYQEQLLSAAKTFELIEAIPEPL